MEDFPGFCDQVALRRLCHEEEPMLEAAAESRGGEKLPRIFLKGQVFLLRKTTLGRKWGSLIARR
jgi:hypothetical protein